jgi:PAS domain S-box-containing protein
MRATRNASGVYQKLDRTMRSTRDVADYLAQAQPLLSVPDVAMPEAARVFDVRTFFTLVAERARDLVGAELAAIGVRHSPDQVFDPWISIGVSKEVAESLGAPPRPVGTLGAVAIRGETLRLHALREHPSFRGLPPNHPELRSFLAVPLRAHGVSIGNLYLANKRGGADFDAGDQVSIEMLAALAASGVRLSALLAAIDDDRIRLRHILDAAVDGIIFVDARTGHVLANRGFQELLGVPITPTDGVAQELGLLCWPDGRPLTAEELPSTRALKGEVTHGLELLVVRRDGRSIPVSAGAAPVHSADGTLLGAVDVLRDITLQKEIENDGVRLRHILDAELDGVIFVDAWTGHLLANRGFQELLGEPIVPTEGVAQEFGLLCWPDGRPLTAEELPSMRALKGEVTHGLELLVIRRDGRRIPVSAGAAPVRSADGTLLGAVDVLRDITMHKEIERLREEFAAMVVHDLRSPIQSMLLQLEILRKTAAEGRPPERMVLDRLTRQCSQLSHLASDLLDSSRVELSRAVLKQVPVDVGEAVEGLVERIRLTLREHEVVVEVRDQPRQAMVDPLRFDQILTNLI